MKSTTSTALSRAFIGTGVAVALASVSLLGAGAANASAADPEVEKVIAANSGTVLVHLPGDEYANATVVVVAPIPGSDEPRVTSASVEPEADADGYAAEVDNLAGPVYIEIINGSASGAGLTSETVEVAPGYDTNASIYRHALVEYTLDEATGEFVSGAVPTSPVPDSTELDYLIPATDYTFTPTSYVTGKAFDVKFRDIVSALDGKKVGAEEPRPINFYAYSAPTFLTAASIVGGAVDVRVPEAYTTAPHELAAFDEFGRINLWISLDGGLAAPVNDPAQGAAKAPVLANTGAGDVSGFAGVGVIALVAGAAAVAAGAVLRSRRAVKA